MSPHPRRRSALRPTARPAAGRGRRLLLVGLLVVLVVGTAACSSPPFDPTGPCTTDGSVAGAYPDLEASVPKSYQGAAPAQLDSGRACTTAGLGTLSAHGVNEMRFAGGTWSTGTDSGLSLAVFTDPDGPALEPAWVAEFYESGARTGKNVTSVDVSDYPIAAGIRGQRIDVLNGESFQSVVVWARDGKVAVALVADFVREIQTKEAHDKVVRSAVDAFGV